MNVLCSLNKIIIFETITLSSCSTKILALTTGKMTSFSLHGTKGLKKNLFSGLVIFTLTIK